MLEVGHNHVAAHVEVVDPDVEDPDVVGHLLVGKKLDSHVVQVALEVDLHVPEDLHVLVVGLLDLKQTRCGTKKENKAPITLYQSPATTRTVLESTRLLFYDKMM
jgi:hypothetical protein